MKKLALLVIVVLVVFTLPGCKKNSDRNSSQLTDSQAATALYQSFNEAFAQVQFVATDQSLGNVNQTITSPNGGKIIVTGTSTYDEVGQRINWMLTFGYWQYRTVYSGDTDFTQNGQVTISGYVNTAGMMQMRMTSSKSAMKGKINGVSFDQDWSYNILITSNNGHGSLSGEFNGRSLSTTF